MSNVGSRSYLTVDRSHVDSDEKAAGLDAMTPCLCQHGLGSLATELHVFCWKLDVLWFYVLRS